MNSNTIKNKDIISNDQILSIINNHIIDKIPGSFIRKGDGENIIIGYNKIKDVKFKDYKRMLRIMNIRFLNFEFQKFVKKALIDAFNNCNVMGISREDQRYKFWAIEDQILEILDFKSQIFCDMNFHMEFIKYPNNNSLENELAKKIISNKKIGIISCYDVSDFLKQHNTVVEKWIYLPKEKRKKIFNKKIDIKLYKKVNQIIENSVVDYWIVAAGIHAKIFCEQIKSNNGIAIDIGSSIDTWKDIYHSREHLKKIHKNKVLTN